MKEKDIKNKKTIKESEEKKVSDSFNAEKDSKKGNKRTAKDVKKDLVVLSKIKKKFNENVIEAKEIESEDKKEIKVSATRRVEEAKKEVHKQSSKFQIYLYTLFFIINIVSFSIFLFLTASSAVNFKDLFTSKYSAWWFIGGILNFGIIMFLEAAILSLLIKKSTNKNSFTLSYKAASIGRYYDSLTPLKLGGQSFQIAYLNKFGAKTSTASSVPVTKFVFKQFTYLLAVVLLVFFMGDMTNFGGGALANFVSITAYVGLVLQLIWLILIVILSYTKKVGPALVVGILKLLYKLKIIKNYRVTYVKVLRFVRDYQETMRKYMNNFLYFFPSFMLALLLMIAKWATPFFMYSCIFGFDLAMLPEIIARVMLCELAMGIWILPGNVIFADITFFALFKPIFHSEYIFWALLLWRILTYYLYVIQGGLIKVYDDVKYNICKKPIKKEQSLKKPKKV